MKPQFLDDDLMTIEEVSKRIRTPVGTIRQWRVYGQYGGGPPAARFGARILFRKSDVEAWINDRFEAPVAPPEFTPPGDAPARGRYFPWACIAEVTAEEVADSLGATGWQRNTIRNAVFDALPSAYDAYMAGIVTHGKHDASEQEAMARFRGSLTERLRAVHDAHAATPRTEAG